MKHCLPFVLFILLSSNILGGTVPRLYPIHHTSGRESDSLYTAPVTLTFPNPFYANDHIVLTLESDAHIELHLYNILGQFIATLAYGNYSVGTYHFSLGNRAYSSGVYFLALKTNDVRELKKIIYLR